MSETLAPATQRHLNARVTWVTRACIAKGSNGLQIATAPGLIGGRREFLSAVSA